MEFSLLALIGISLAAMFFGYFFGLFEGRGQGYKKGRQEGTAEAAALKPVVPAPAPPPAAEPVIPLPSAAALADHGENSLLRLSMDPNQQPCLDLDGERVDTAQMEPQQRRRLIDLMVLMRPWIEAGPVARSQPQPQPTPAVPPAPPSTPAGTLRQTVPPFDAPSIPPPVPSRATGPLNAPSSQPEPVAAPTSMVGQIDAILQTKLTGTPLATRGIRLVESSQGGAMVVVGLNRYSGVGDVPDPEVQAVIRGAIAEWENRYTPG